VCGTYVSLLPHPTSVIDNAKMFQTTAVSMIRWNSLTSIV
jgi:hypothetical protein